VSGLTLILEKTHCCKRKILHTAHPGVFSYLDMKNSVMGNEISIPTSAIPEMSWQFIKHISENLSEDSLMTTVPNM
jgi:hypothetical protein